MTICDYYVCHFQLLVTCHDQLAVHKSELLAARSDKFIPADNC